MTVARAVVIFLGTVVLFFGSVGAGFMIGHTAFRYSTPQPQQAAKTGPVYTEPPAPPQAQAPEQSPPPGPVPAGGEKTPRAAAQPPAGPAIGGPPASGNAPAPAPTVPEPAPPTPAAPQPQPGGAPGVVVTPTSPLPGPVTTPADDSSTRFHVQAGSFDEPQNAQALAVRLRSLGYAVSVTAGPPYRVWIGGYFDKTTAERLADNLRNAGFDVTLAPR